MRLLRSTSAGKVALVNMATFIRFRFLSAFPRLILSFDFCCAQRTGSSLICFRLFCCLSLAFSLTDIAAACSSWLTALVAFFWLMPLRGSFGVLSLNNLKWIINILILIQMCSVEQLWMYVNTRSHLIFKNCKLDQCKIIHMIPKLEPLCYLSEKAWALKICN